MSIETKPRSKERRRKKRESIQKSSILQEYRQFLDQKTVVLDDTFLYESFPEEIAKSLIDTEISLKKDEADAPTLLKSSKKLFSLVKKDTIESKNNLSVCLIECLIYSE